MKDPRIIERTARTCRRFDGVDWERFIELLGVDVANDLEKLLEAAKTRRWRQRTVQAIKDV